MSEEKQKKEQLERLAQQIRQDQAKSSSAEKRVKIKTSFRKALKRMAQTPTPKKEKK